ncbi:pyridoxal-phosphate dependent enzyme [uncultured Roseobacter sp.]|uniref:pyridoxal-phosphate dependent enzyme n=1 Tax=uncultured Roseobacter sp. TaxID=114847 RepID=UPI00260462E4|nr:pyridoxal-phosphate dependent enzyme [uncultured Roseobacter sp.]
MFPSTGHDAVAELLALCPKHAVTPLREAPDVAKAAGVSTVFIKDERGRMGLGSFKALGAAFAIAGDARRKRRGDWQSALTDRVYVTASAGNHGLSVAAGARIFGAQAVIYLAETVPEAFAQRLTATGARVVRAGQTYEQSMQAAADAADANGWQLLSDSSWAGYTEWPGAVMQGYLQMAAEITDEMTRAPDVILLQAGVGGLAASLSAHFRNIWGDAPVIIVVEPEAAPALTESIRAGTLVNADGPVSAMGRLDCKTPSLVALEGLARDADLFVTISEAEAGDAVAKLSDMGLATTPSGAAGLAALLAGLPECGPGTTVLTVMSEGPEDA